MPGRDILKILNCKILISANLCETQNQIWIQPLWLDVIICVEVRQGATDQKWNILTFLPSIHRAQSCNCLSDTDVWAQVAGVLQRVAAHPGLQYHFSNISRSFWLTTLKGENDTSFPTLHLNFFICWEKAVEVWFWALAFMMPLILIQNIA